MMITRKQTVLAVVLTGALTLTSAIAQTPDSVQTRIGTLNFVDGVPTVETAQKVYDNLDFQRGTQVFKA